MPKVQLADLRKTHEALCRMLETKYCYGTFTIDEVSVIKKNVEREIAEVEAVTTANGSQN